VNLFLLVLFGIHFGVTLVLYLRRRQRIYAALTAVFLCLVASALIKLCAPQWKVLDIEMSTAFRIAALALSCLTLSLRLASAMKTKGDTASAD